MDDSDLPPELREDRVAWAELLYRSSVRDFVKDNFGLYQPPGDYRALREENLKRTADAALRRLSRS